MPIKEESFRIGCGRYIQGVGYIEKLGDEVLRLGKSPLIIGGKTALEITKSKIEKSVETKCNKYEFIEHTGTCNEERANELAELARKKGYDVIVGVGGGVICDLAKLCAYYAHTPVVNVPTSSATCASYTPLSVRYTPDGKTVGSIHYGYEVDCVIADTEILVKQPVRLFIAGVFDALAKFVEIKQRYTEDSTDYPVGLDYAYVLSKYTFNILNSKVQKCIDDMQKGVVSDDFEKLVFASIAATGVISGIARGSNQTAAAHKFYEATRFFFPKQTRKYTHGEIVGVGLILQNHFNGEEENNKIILELMKKYEMPCCIEDMGIDKTDEVFDKYYAKICDSSAVETVEESIRFKESLKYLWEIK